MCKSYRYFRWRGKDGTDTKWPSEECILVMVPAKLGVPSYPAWAKAFKKSASTIALWGHNELGWAINNSAKPTSSWIEITPQRAKEVLKEAGIGV